ncbi:MAG: type I-E CRISPR-associated protein Cas7/Cse4/CasC [Gammaproteobacteria bacterium]|nr:type I-E CRISPR-associated protein Cas7/Cse4/CasC [Gammaproteobacteria bacterium]MDE0440780.1 type I-E CRISPR-associated protein Cas7/Cse4/CasC [Gammaproteobacteria bacterium]
MNHRFLQIHTLTPYTAALLNRDDAGLAKRLPYGGVMRTRISSQCLKRHWRIADDPHALHTIDGAEAARRSRELVTKQVIAPLRGNFADDVVEVLESEFQMAVYGDKGTTKSGRQTLLFGVPEIEWLTREAERLATESNGSAATAKAGVVAWRKDFRANIKAMRDQTALPAGIEGALFGRMVTSDSDANITAPVHVAHAFTVHAEEAEDDYFTAVDDLAGDEPGADTIQETELTSGLFYGYVVVDIPGLLDNVSGDAGLAGDVLHNLIYLIAEVSPGAKLGSTAPYGRASMVLLEAGNRQPRSLASAFATPSAPVAADAAAAVAGHLKLLDEAYATEEERRLMSVVNVEMPRAARGSLADLAQWARSLPA